MKTNLDRLRIFYHVACAKSFTHSSLFITRPAISRHITLLEHELNLKLFKRLPRELVLTPAGEALFKSVKEIIEKLDETITDLSENKEDARGNLSIFTHAGWASSRIVNLASNFSAAYPKVSVSVVLTDSIPEFTVSSTHMAIIPSKLPNTSLVQEPVVRFRSRMVASKDYAKKFGIPKTLDELEDHRLIGYGEHENTFPDINWHLFLQKPLGETRKPHLMVNNMQYAIQEGLGIAPSAPLLVSDRVELIDVLPEYRSKPNTIYCVYPKHLQEFTRIKFFLEFFKKRIIEMQKLRPNEDVEVLI